MLTITKEQSALFQDDSLHRLAHHLIAYLRPLYPQPWAELELPTAVAKAREIIDVALAHGLDYHDEIERLAEVMTLAPHFLDSPSRGDALALLADENLVREWPESAGVVLALVSDGMEQPSAEQGAEA